MSVEEQSAADQSGEEDLRLGVAVMYLLDDRKNWPDQRRRLRLKDIENCAQSSQALCGGEPARGHRPLPTPHCLRAWVVQGLWDDWWLFRIEGVVSV